MSLHNFRSSFFSPAGDNENALSDGKIALKCVNIKNCHPFKKKSPINFVNGKKKLLIEFDTQFICSSLWSKH